MKSRYSSLVGLKKNSVQSSERAVQDANMRMKNALSELESSLGELESIETPSHGKISSFLSNRALLEAQRAQIKHNKEWVAFTQQELETTKRDLQKSMREYEKFKYLEHKEIEEKLKLIKQKEAKDLDEIALISHARKIKQEKTKRSD